MILFGLLASTVVAAQVNGPGLFGPTAGHLTADDVHQITALFRDTGSPWLMYGDSQGWMPGWHVVVYFTPDRVAGRVRSGRLKYATASLTNPDDFSGSHTWSPLAGARTEAYAQVSLPHTDPTHLTAPRDLNRPFRIFGDLSDDELVTVVEFVRTSPRLEAPHTRPAPPLATFVRGTWPIVTIRAGTASRVPGTVEVSLIDENPRERSGQTATLMRVDGRWTVKSISFWVAD